MSTFLYIDGQSHRTGQGDKQSKGGKIRCTAFNDSYQPQRNSCLNDNGLGA